MTRLPFNFTPQIFRYLETLDDISKKTWADKTDNEVCIDCYILGEDKSVETDINNSSFWEYLEDIGAIQLAERTSFAGVQVGKEIEAEIIEHKAGGGKTFIFAKRYLKILDIEKIRLLLKERKKNTRLSPKALELIAKEIGNLMTGTEIVSFLRDCDVPASMIIYPNTKWRTVNEVFKVLNTSQNKEARNILYSILEEVINPLFHDGDEQSSEALKMRINSLLKQNGYWISEGVLHWYIDEDGYWENSRGESHGPRMYLVLPDKISGLYLFWNEIIKLTRFYFANKRSQTDEINPIYFELIQTVENLLQEKGVGILKEEYKRPFNNLFGCEFEIKKSGGSEEETLERLHIYLGKITEECLPYEKYIAEYRKSNKPLLDRVASYTTTHTNLRARDLDDKIGKALDDAIVRGFNSFFVDPLQQQNVHKIEITAMPELQVKNMGGNDSAKGKKRESPIDLSFPEPVRWERVTLKIKEGRQEVEIFYDNSHIITADYRQLRFFVGKKQQKPDRQWGFLCALSTLSATEIQQATAENMRRMITENKTLSINNVQQVKKMFVERLQDIFKTSDDPFNDRRDYYEPKFKILPEPALRREEVWPQDGKLNESRGDETDRLAYEEKRVQEEAEE